VRKFRLVFLGLLHLLRQLLAKAHELRHVANIGDDAEESAVLVENGVSRDENLLLALDGLVDRDALELLHDEESDGLVEVAFLDELAHGPPDDLLRPDPRDPLIGLVDVQHAALAVGHPDAVVGGMDDGLELAVEPLDDTELVGNRLDA